MSFTPSKNNHKPSKPSNSSQTTSVFAAQSYSGPIPKADEVSKYQQIDERFVDFFIDAANEQRTQRHKTESELLIIEKTENTRAFTYKMLGQVFAFLIVLLFIGMSLYCLIHDKADLASKFIGWGLVSVVALFLGAKAVEKLFKNNTTDN